MSTKRRNLIYGYIFIAPAILGFLLLYLFPMLFSLGISFTEWDIVTPPRFVGWANYSGIFSDPISIAGIRATSYYAVLAVPLINIVALISASLLNTKTRATSAFRTIFYIPSIVPAVAAAAVWMFMYSPMNGFLNEIIGWFGIPKQMWIYSKQQVIPCIAVMAAWSSGSTAIIYLASLQGVPASLYEAADIDGASFLRKFVSITLPMISPIVFYNVLMAVIGSLQVFTQAFIMTGGKGGPDNASMFYVLAMYNKAFQFGKMGFASAMAWILFIATVVLTVIAFRISSRVVYYEEG